jgi:hypothetical protein
LAHILLFLLGRGTKSNFLTGFLQSCIANLLSMTLHPTCHKKAGQQGVLQKRMTPPHTVSETAQLLQILRRELAILDRQGVVLRAQGELRHH